MSESDLNVNDPQQRKAFDPSLTERPKGVPMRDERTIEDPGDPEFFLTPLLANDLLPFLFDGEGHALDAEGRRADNGNGVSVSPVIARLQREALGQESKTNWVSRLLRRSGG